MLSRVVGSVDTTSSGLTKLGVNSRVGSSLVADVGGIIDTLARIAGTTGDLATLPPVRSFGARGVSSMVDGIRGTTSKVGNLAVKRIGRSIVAGVGGITDTLARVSKMVAALAALPPVSNFSPVVVSATMAGIRATTARLSGLDNVAIKRSIGNILKDVGATLRALGSALTGTDKFDRISIGVKDRVIDNMRSNLSSLDDAIRDDISDTVDSTSNSTGDNKDDLKARIGDNFRSALGLRDVVSARVNCIGASISGKVTTTGDTTRSKTTRIIRTFGSKVGMNSPKSVTEAVRRRVLCAGNFVLNDCNCLEGSTCSTNEMVISSFNAPGLDLGCLDDGSSGLSTLSAVGDSISVNRGGDGIAVIIDRNTMGISTEGGATHRTGKVVALTLRSVSRVAGVSISIWACKGM